MENTSSDLHVLSFAELTAATPSGPFESFLALNTHWLYLAQVFCLLTPLAIMAFHLQGQV